MCSSDLKGPVTPPSIHGIQLVVCIIDSRSHFGFVYPIRHKSEMPEVFKRFWADTALIRKKFPIHCVKSDNAGENKSQALNEFFISKGVRREFSTPNRAEQNGFAELYIRELVRLTRLLLRISGLPHTLWLRAFLYAAGFLNL